MKKLAYYVLDVFTDRKYKGNQLSVVYTDEELRLEQYYDIAREFGYSETSFVTYNPSDKVLKVRSFTPANFEIKGAGHNLLGAVILALLKWQDISKDKDDVPWVSMAGTKIPLKITKQDEIPYVGMLQPPAEIIGKVPAEIIAKAVNLTVDDLKLNNWDINIVRTEVGHLMVPIKNVDSLKKAVLNKTLLKDASRNFGFEGCYLFTTTLENTAYLAETRFFNPSIGIDEDPATGTAAGPLAGYLEKLDYIKQGQDHQILQGAYINHPSDIHVKVVADGVWVSGSAVIIMEGNLYL